MSKIEKGRWAADTQEREFVCFLIGMRINRLLMPWKWMPVLVAMPKMIAELMRQPELGLRGRPRTFLSGRTILVQQYWDSFESLESYARASDRHHLPAWRAFNRAVRDNGTVGIWHETYVVTPGSCETVYANMPRFGAGAAFGVVPPSRGGQSAALRLRRRPDDVPPIEPY